MLTKRALLSFHRLVCRSLLLLLFVVSLSLCLYGESVSAQGKDKPSAVERITDKVYRVGKILVDLEARTATCPGEINLDSGSIEYLAVAPGGKTHESLLRLAVRPLHLQIALLLLGLEPENVLARQGDPKTPLGDRVELRVRWQDSGGKAHEVRAEELVAEMPGSRVMPNHAWVFTGSRVLKEGFEADLSKSLIAVWHDPAAILDNPLPGGANNAYRVNERRVPRRGTGIEFVLKAIDKPETKPRREK